MDFKSHFTLIADPLEETSDLCYESWILISLDIDFACLYVSLYPINVKTADQIGPKFRVGKHMTPGKVYGCSNLQKFVSKVFEFGKILKMREKYYLILELFLFVCMFS